MMGNEIVTVSTADALPGPYNIYELAPGQSHVFTVAAWRVGKMTIVPRDGRKAKEILALRVTVGPGELATLPGYWDITSGHLLAGIVADLQQRGAGKARYTVTKVGSGPAARFTLAATPL